MKTSDRTNKMKTFDEVPDIIDPNFSNYLKNIIQKEFGNVSWHIKMYIADDGTGTITVASIDRSHGQSYRESNIMDSTDGLDSSNDSIKSWTKRLNWKWDEKHPSMVVYFETMNTEKEFVAEQRILYRYDMSKWKDTLIYGEMKETNTTSESKDKDGEQKADFGWERGSKNSNDTSMQNLREGDKSADTVDTDEISMTFAQAYDMWMNEIRPRLNVGSESDIPRPFDCKGKSEQKLINMIQHFDDRLVEIKEHKAADAGNIDNYVRQFSEIREAYRYMDKNLRPHSTNPRDNFEDNWMEFKSKMDILIELLTDYSSRF